MFDDTVWKRVRQVATIRATATLRMPGVLLSVLVAKVDVSPRQAACREELPFFERRSRNALQCLVYVLVFAKTNFVEHNEIERDGVLRGHAAKVEDVDGGFADAFESELVVGP
jgi:hypothetical protein